MFDGFQKRKIMSRGGEDASPSERYSICATKLRSQKAQNSMTAVHRFSRESRS